MSHIDPNGYELTRYCEIFPQYIFLGRSFNHAKLFMLNVKTQQVRTFTQWKSKSLNPSGLFIKVNGKFYVFESCHHSTFYYDAVCRSMHTRVMLDTLYETRSYDK